jgi:hypothetical protein
MATDPQAHRQENLQLTLDAATFKELMRDLLFREAGKPYFKQFYLPRQRWRRWLGDWQPLSTYEAEKAMLPVGGRQIDQHIRQFFTTNERLQVTFQESGMPVTAIFVLQQRCPQLNAALEHVLRIECAIHDERHYRVDLQGGPAPPPAPHQDASEAV